MSYARTGTDSDVYVFADSMGKFHCATCACVFSLRGEMILHLLFHREGAHAGRVVPDCALERLAEEEELEAKYGPID